MMYQQLPEHHIVLFHCVYNPAVECPPFCWLGQTIFGIICAKNYVSIKAVQLKLMVAHTCTMGRKV